MLVVLFTADAIWTSHVNFQQVDLQVSRLALSMIAHVGGGWSFFKILSSLLLARGLRLLQMGNTSLLQGHMHRG